MVEFHPIELSPELRTALAPLSNNNVSQARQQAEQRRQQAELNRVLAERRAAHQQALEAVHEAAQQGRYF